MDNGREQIHIPVLVEETMEILGVSERGTYVDATLGLGGHAEAILSCLGPDAVYIGIDEDEEALAYAKGRLGNRRLVLRKGRFSQMEQILRDLNIESVDGVLFDLGASMLQMKTARRGFSFTSQERLDMRMDASQDLSAWDVVNRYPERTLERILREYGEEPRARRIARTIAARREGMPITTCLELAGLVAEVCGKKGGRHPATRTFQAIRMEVNGEVQEIAGGLSSAVRMLRRGGRLSVISYHSIEDRIVKHFMRDGAREGVVRIITKKPITPAPDEIRRNPSSRSAKLRGAERL